jgi:hypothetical protein
MRAVAWAMRPQVCGTFKSCKSSSNRTKLQRNLNNIGVRSFILTGAPTNKINDFRDILAAIAAIISGSRGNNRERLLRLQSVIHDRRRKSAFSETHGRKIETQQAG